MSSAVQITGLKEVTKAFKQYEGGVADLKAINLLAAEPVRLRALELVPVRSGALRDSIRAGAQAKTGVVRAGKVAVPYAGPIHFGWSARNIAPQPFLYDALDQRREEVIEEYRKALLGIKAKSFGGSDSSSAAYDNELIEYTTKKGATRMATRAQVNNWTRGSQSL